MSLSIRNLFGRRPAANPRRRPRPVMGFDALEGRQLLSLLGASRVNHVAAGVRDNSANASSTSGLMVAAWVDRVNGVDQIRAQVYTINKMWNGGEIVVDNAPLYSNDDSPRVAINDSGNFVVTWHNRNQANGTDTVWAAEYNFWGGLIHESMVGNQPGDAQFMPDVVMDSWGDFYVSYIASHFNGSESVMVEAFDVYGYPSSIRTVDFTESGAFSTTHIVMAPSGSFVVGYNSYNSDFGAWGLDLEGFSATGSRSFSTIIAYQQYDPIEFALASNSWGGVAVARIAENGNGTSSLYLDRVDYYGNDYDTVGLDSSGATLYHPSIAADQHNDKVVVVCDTSSLFNAPGWSGLEIKEVGADDSIIGTYGIYPSSSQWSDPAVSIDGNGEYFVTFSVGGDSGGERDVWDYMGRLDFYLGAKRLGSATLLR
jgi:hypothetical protein